MKSLFVTCACLFMLGSFSELQAQLPVPTQSERGLLIGLIPEQDIFAQLERYQPVADYLSRRIGVRITLKILTRYGNLIDNFNSLGLDGAFFGSFSYALAHKKLGLEVLARPERLNGASTYHGVIFVRKDSGIKSPRDVKGKVFVFVDKATTAGYLLPLAWLIEHGIEDYKSYLKETYFSGTHEDAVLDVLNKRADIGAAKNTIYDAMAKANPRLDSELTILATSPEVPENALAVRNDLSDSLKKMLRRALLTMHADPEGSGVLLKFGASRFILTRDEDYNPVFTYAREARIDLATYDYRND